MDKELSDHSNEEIKLTGPNKPSFLKNMSRKVRLYFFQFFMLFLAITAGFFAENLREEFGERKQSREYAKSMVNDLVRDTLNIQYHISRLKVAVNSITDLANYVRDKQVNQIKNLDLFRLTMFPWNPPFRWSRATLEQIKSSGSLRYFTNDSIIYYISQYDAVTLHLDQDNLEDQQRYLQAMEKKSRVVDMNYPGEFIMHLRSNADSLMQTSGYADMNSSKQLLTSDINEVKLMVNAYLIAKDYSTGRINELSNLVHDQSRLIRLLRREYNLQ
jgi:hypothetical protein